MNKYTGLKEGNEDTFTTNVIMPVLLTAFPGIANSIFRWGGVFRPGQTIFVRAPNGDLISITNRYFSLVPRLYGMEKPEISNIAEQNFINDEAKIANMMKKGLDYWTPY
ncbi:hypothetical protein BCR41DRAFT_374716 [Lobosporangium transversale]|uniref:Uncharacterized protein n=1 Tax=Lobosporangium transversale TaxID=64571 RepID=A0A1Y2G9E5_9FUNG|nr:hypothetical protein BCR41DRAFT_374716 [Lobosporangium transversale]ORZ04811.1 hypothetical protein BCR41DRAFT_374716 [Lobosporangium transversale]|eukprot:XP_021876748.1 hypothetical protein BCR41DRAFT_374716 [Lobosporangium transversale]